MYHQTIVKTNAEDVATAAHDWLIETIQETIASRGRCSLALSGGSTPKRLYQIIVESSLDSLDWSRVDLVWGDERNVPHDHVDSNYKMVREAWLDRLDPTKAYHVPRIFPVQISVNAPERAAAEYELQLRRVLDPEQKLVNDFPSLDIVLLGLGDDAHTASLFPETEALEETKRLFVANYVPKFAAYRLTLTAPMINAAKNVAFLVCGLSKRPAMEVVLHGPRHPNEYPAQLIEPKHGRLLWFVDAAASPES